MIRRFNFTGRKKIEMDKVSIVRRSNPGFPSSFEAEINLADLELPSGASVFVEAHRRSNLMRFPFGTVGKLISPEDRRLTAFAADEAISFRVKVVDTSSAIGRLLALARNVPCVTPEENKANRIPILPVEQRPLGQELWTIDFEETRPVLVVNVDVTEPTDMMQVARNNHQFRALVYPDVVRQILKKIVIEDGMDSPEDDDSQWLRFITEVLIVELPPNVGKSRENVDKVNKWIDVAVATFCEVNGFRDKYQEARMSPLEQS
jgi:hypothetical protein